MRVSLAPVPYFWSKQAYLEFYRQVAESPVDIVYLGETVCAKRRALGFQDWLDIAENLVGQGKQVVLSTLTLLEADSELKYLTRIAAQNDYMVEANDLAAAQVASEHDNRFAAGSAINIYNKRTLDRLVGLGMRRWCVPVELGREDLKPMLAHARKINLEVEYQVFGRMPLAYSARCFTARHLQLAKDDCQFKCQDYEQGIAVATQEGDSFAQINGIQTQSGKVTNLLDRWQELRAEGIDILRVVPLNAEDTLAVLYHLHARITDNPATTAVPDHYEYCNGYWYQQEGIRSVTA